jgi:hypothetical protein
MPEMQTQAPIVGHTYPHTHLHWHRRQHTRPTCTHGRADTGAHHASLTRTRGRGGRHLPVLLVLRLPLQPGGLQQLRRGHGPHEGHPVQGRGPGPGRNTQGHPGRGQAVLGGAAGGGTAAGPTRATPCRALSSGGPWGGLLLPVITLLVHGRYANTHTQTKYMCDTCHHLLFKAHTHRYLWVQLTRRFRIRGGCGSGGLRAHTHTGVTQLPTWGDCVVAG